MSEMIYVRCPACRGSAWLHGEGVGLSAPCPCARTDHPGWAPTGLTMGQIDRMVDLERALAGDPGLPVERRREILRAARQRPGWEVLE